MTHGAAPAALTLAVVRQDQAGAFAVVTGRGQELSLLPSPALVARQIYPRSGDLVAVQGERIVGHWARAVVLRPAPGGVRLRLSTGAQIVAAAPPDLAPALRTGDPVFTSPTAILARAWTWFEPEEPSPAVLAAALASLPTDAF